MLTVESQNSNSAPPRNNLNQLPSKSYNIKDFTLKIYQAEKTIIFISSEIEDLSATLYKGELDLDGLYKLNRAFKQFDTIEDVFNDFFKVLDESKILIKKEGNTINLIIICESLGKTSEAKIILIPEQAKIEDIVMKLCEKVKEIDILKKEFSDYKNYMENKIKEIIKENENLKKNIEFFNGNYFSADEINKMKEKNDSHILKLNELFLIQKGVKKKLNKNIKKYNLLFRASIDGYGASNFHSKCDGKSNTVTLVETTTGRRFGGFTDAQWDQSNNYKTGSNGFIFSLDYKEIYYNKNSNYNIYSNSSYGPAFGGGHDFYICDNCNSSNSSYDNSPHSYETNGKKNALAGCYYFTVKDYEVYQIELE